MTHLSLKESAYNILKEKILNGDFEPGSRIREDILANEISMSRTPVREAINQLSAEGFLNNIPRKGIYSIDLSESEIADLLDLRVTLEFLAADRFIDRANGKHIENLEKNMADFESACLQEDYMRCNRLDGIFHLAIANASGNGRMVKFLCEIEDFMHIARNSEKKLNPKEKNLITLQEHKDILAALKNHDRTAARQAIKKNIDTMRRNLGMI